jgi:hypothetical protein
MDISEGMVLELADRANGFARTWGSERADAHVAERVAAVRQRFTQDGLDLTPPEAVAQIEAEARTNWDASARKTGVILETDLEAAVAILDDRMSAAQQLTPTVEPLISRQERQLEELTALLAEDRLRALVANLTRREVIDLYQQADDQTQAGRRLVVQLEALWPSLTFRADPDTDATALLAWRKVSDERRTARVPPELSQWRERLVTAQRGAGFTTTMRHLRAGRGIAKRPTPLQVVG